MIRLATKDDLKDILFIYAKARKFMEATGNPDQWGKNRPTYESIITDIELKRMYTIMKHEKMLGVFSIYEYLDGKVRDVDYDNIQGEWLNDKPYVAIHKIASSGYEGGIFEKALEFAKSKSDNIRIDTHKYNRIMQMHIKRSGFRYTGIVYIDGKLERLAYHLDLSEDR